MESLAEHVTRRRLELRISKSELARRAGLSYVTVKDIEAGRRPVIQDGTAARLAAALQETLDVLDAVIGGDASVGRAPDNRVSAPMEATLRQQVVRADRRVERALLDAERAKRLIDSAAPGDDAAAAQVGLTEANNEAADALRDLDELKRRHDHLLWNDVEPEPEPIALSTPGGDDFSDLPPEDQATVRRVIENARARHRGA